MTDADAVTPDDRTSLDWVDVVDEPNHIEQFRNHTVRIYLATIPPGTATLYHRHTADTRYVIMTGGRFRSDEPGKQRPGTVIGRSTSRVRQLGWLIGRAISGGWLRMPAGTVLVQPHRAHPLMHRVIAADTNTAAMQMLGIELLHTVGPTALPTSPQLRLEHADDRARTYRLRLAPGTSGNDLNLPRGAVIAPITGMAVVSTAPHMPLAAGQGHWITPGRGHLSAHGSLALDALLITV